MHVQKTGGSSIEAMFGIGPDPFANPECPDDRRHMRLDEYRARFPDVFGEYFKFAFVRNPWDRLVSRYCHAQEVMAQRMADVDAKIAEVRAIANAEKRDRKLAKLAEKRAAMEASPYHLPFRDWVHAAVATPRKDLHQLYDEGLDTAPLFNFIGRYERLHDDLRIAFDRIGVEPTALPHVNKGQHRHYMTYYDDETRDIVARQCARDIERFGYRFGD